MKPFEQGIHDDTWTGCLVVIGEDRLLRHVDHGLMYDPPKGYKRSHAWPDGTHGPNPERAVVVLYRNWEGSEGPRRIVPYKGGIYFGATAHHPEPQWLLDVWDLYKDAPRVFALKDIKSWD